MGELRKNILITGASGFIGRNLVEYLSPQHNIFAPSHAQLELLDEEAVRKYLLSNKIQIVVHCANIGGGRDTIGASDVVYKNLRMFFAIVRNIDNLEKVIHLGSGAVYDHRRKLVKVKEDHLDKHIPTDDYSFVKYVFSKYCQNSPKIVELRLFAVFGKYENYYFKFISNAIVKNLFKMPIVIAQNVNFDFLYIEDLVKIIEHFTKIKPKCTAYNAASGKSVDLITIAKKINKISNFKSKIIVLNPGLNLEYTANIQRLRKEIPNLKFTPLDAAITKLYSWYQKNIDQIDEKKIKRDPYLKYVRVNL